MKGWIKKMAHNFGWNDPREQYGNSQAQQSAMNQMKAAQLQHQYAMAQAQANNAFGQYAAQQAQPVNYRQTLGSTPKGLSPTFEQLEDLDSPFNLPLEALSVMWGARFGYRWIKDEDTADAIEENTDLWSIVSARLIEAGLLVHQQYRHPDKIGMGTAWRLIEKDHGNS